MTNDDNNDNDDDSDNDHDLDDNDDYDGDNDDYEHFATFIDSNYMISQSFGIIYSYDTFHYE